MIWTKRNGHWTLQVAGIKSHLTKTTKSIGLLDERASLLDTSWHEHSLYLSFLPGQQIYFGVVGAIAGQFDFNPVFARADEHGAEFSTKFTGVAHEFIVKKHSGALRLDVELQCCGNLGCGGARALQHYGVNDLNLAGFNHNLFFEVVIPGLSDDHFVLTGQQHDFFVAL